MKAAVRKFSFWATSLVALFSLTGVGEAAALGVGTAGILTPGLEPASSPIVSVVAPAANLRVSEAPRGDEDGSQAARDASPLGRVVESSSETGQEESDYEDSHPLARHDWLGFRRIERSVTLASSTPVSWTTGSHNPRGPPSLRS